MLLRSRPRPTAGSRDAARRRSRRAPARARCACKRASTAPRPDRAGWLAHDSNCNCARTRRRMCRVPAPLARLRARARCCHGAKSAAADIAPRPPHRGCSPRSAQRARPRRAAASVRFATVFERQADAQAALSLQAADGTSVRLESDDEGQFSSGDLAGAFALHVEAPGYLGPSITLHVPHRERTYRCCAPARAPLRLRRIGVVAARALPSLELWSDGPLAKRWKARCGRDARLRATDRARRARGIRANTAERGSLSGPSSLNVQPTERSPKCQMSRELY